MKMVVGAEVGGSQRGCRTSPVFLPANQEQSAEKVQWGKQLIIRWNKWHQHSSRIRPARAPVHINPLYLLGSK